MTRAKILLFLLLESLFSAIADHAETARQRFAICPDCGANRYTGRPCVNFERKESN